MKEAKLAPQVNVQTSLSTSDKTKPSRKRKRPVHDASIDGESADVGSNVTIKSEPPRKSKKRKERCTPPLPYPDPAVDDALSQQSRKALSYVYERCQKVDQWKFNKARQNWLLRNIWSEQAVPKSYVPLVTEYLVGIKGSAREKLIAMCTSKLMIDDDESMQPSTQPFNGSNDVVCTKQPPDGSRALSILNALREDSQNDEVN